MCARARWNDFPSLLSSSVGPAPPFYVIYRPVCDTCVHLRACVCGGSCPLMDWMFDFCISVPGSCCLTVRAAKVRGWRRHIRISQQSGSQSPRGSFCLLFALTVCVCVCVFVLSVLFHTVLLSPKWMCHCCRRSSQRESLPLATPIIFKSCPFVFIDPCFTLTTKQRKHNKK